MGLTKDALRQLWSNITEKLDEKAANIDLTTHTEDKNNPHEVTYAQLGDLQLKYDTYANWKITNPVLKQGEIAIATVSSSDNIAHLADATTSILFKVGPGEFNTLPWVSAMSADVHAWAKKSEADFKLWLKTILSPTDFNVYSKDEVDAAHTEITNKITALETKMDIGDATVSEFVDGKIETAFSNMAKAEEVAW